MRIMKKNYYLDIAEVFLKQSTCIRRNFGAAIVKNDSIISTGYNWRFPNEKNCCYANKCITVDMNMESGKGC